MAWQTATITELVKETTDTVSLTLQCDEQITWLPGQHISVKINIDGKEYKRVFSISSEVGQGLRLTVKKVKNGLVSKYLNEKSKVGQQLQITKASGRFCHQSDKNNRNSYYFFAAGSGITPIYSMMVHILTFEPNSYVYLLYGNKNGKSTIFKEQLQELNLVYPQQLVIEHCHTSPSWLANSPWWSGRINAESINKFISENPPYAQSCRYYVCGPDQFIPEVKQALNNIDVPNSCIFTERFTANTSEPNTSIEIAQQQLTLLNISLHNNNHQLQVEPDQSLLQAMKNKGLDVPYSCEAGVCGVCQCHLVNGEVMMQHNSVLSKKELAEGKILACQSYAQSPEISIKYVS